MQGGRCWDEVRRVAVGEQSSGAQRKWSAPAAVQRGGGGRHRLRVRLKHGGLLGLLVLAGHFPVASLDAFFLHGEGPVDLGGAGDRFILRHVAVQLLSNCGTHVVQLEVEAAGVAHRLPVGVASPQRCRARVTVGTKRPGSLADNLRGGLEII